MELTRKNYFSKEAEKLYLGSSSFKAWDILANGCEARETAKRNGEWQEKENPAFLLGSYVHSWSSGDLKEFIAETPQLFKKDGTLLAKYALGDKMIDTLKNDKLIEKIREGEKEQIFTGDIGGVGFKVQVDILNLQKGYFADIKTTKDLKETYWNSNKKCKETFIEKYDYFTQIAIYSEVLRQNTGLSEYLEPYIIAIDKKEIPDKEVIFMGTSWIPQKLEEIKNKLPRIISVRNGEEEPVRCEYCDYCIATRKLTVPITLTDYKTQLGLI